MEVIMVHYYKTTGIYSDVDCLRVEVHYNKGNGYEARITPCAKSGDYYSIFYSPEYFQYYNTLTCMLVPCSRKSAKKEQEAYFLMKDKMNWLLEQYVTMAENNGGRHIEIVGELED
jgi:hypothetical protein